MLNTLNDKIHILIVDSLDDNLNVLENILRELKLKDLHVTKALSGKECLEIAISRNVELIILDTQIPDMNGLEVAKFITLNPKTKHIPIIFLTASFKKEAFVRAGFKLGAIDYSIKPIEKYSFLAKITVYINLFEKQKELLLVNTKLDAVVDTKTAGLVMANTILTVENKDKDKQANELVIADNKKLFFQQKVQLSQKMEAVGKLTFGISHEYNNMLGIISGYSQLIKLTVAEHSELTGYANQIQHASDRAAKLTRKLLTFFPRKNH